MAGWAAKALTMKPLKIIIGIVGGAIVITGGLALKSKIAYDQDGQAITKLIAEYKALGVPTTKAAFTKLYPQITLTAQDEKNLVGQIPRGPSQIAKAILLGCIPSDAPFLERVLQQTKKQRDEFISGRRVRYLLMIDDNLVLSFLLAALLESYKHNPGSMELNLKQAVSIINYSIIWPRSIDAYVGAYMSRYVLQTFLRIIEQSPTMTSKILSMMGNPNLILPINTKGVIYEQFLNDLVAARHLDSPILDKKRPPSFLRRFIKVPTDDEILNAMKDHSGDYVPESKTARFILRERLEKWNSVIKAVAKATDPEVLPSSDDLLEASTLSTSIPSDIANFFNQDETLTQGTKIFQSNTDFRVLLQIVTHALTIKSSKGVFPEKLAEVLPPADPNDYRYQTIPGGFKAEIIWHDAKRPSYVHYRISYPLESSVGVRLMAIYRNQIAKAKKELVSSSPKG